MDKTFHLFAIAGIYHAIAFSRGSLHLSIIFPTKAWINSFRLLHPVCTQTGRNDKIIGNDIGNPEGLNSMESICGHLWITDHAVISDISGHHGLDYIKASVISPLSNFSIISLSGQELISCLITKPTTLINLESMPARIYFDRPIAGKQVANKIVIVK